MPTLSFHDVSKCYGKVPALDAFTLDIAEGKLSVLLGASGSGKTTALRLAAGLERADCGHIALDGRMLDALPPRERGCALVFQNYSLYPQMSAAENIAYPLRVRGIGVKERQRRVAWAADLLKLSAAEMARRPHALSGGQRQRVAFGKALALHPEVLLLDEPFSSLDHNLRVALRGELRRIQRELGITVLMVTHDQGDALAIADVVAIMERGRIQQVGPPEDLWSHPVTRFVAGFLGTPPMSFVAARMEGNTLTLSNGETLHLASGLPHTGQVALGLRPQDLLLETSDQGRATFVMTGIERIGSEFIAYGDYLGAQVAVAVANEAAVNESCHLHIVRISMLFDDRGSALHPAEIASWEQN